MDRDDGLGPVSHPAVASRRLRQAYISLALIVWNTLVAFLVLNVLLGIMFAIKDGLDTARMAALAAHVSVSASFNADGSPVDNGKRNTYQLAWIDLHAYGEMDPSSVADVLDDFYELNRQGMAYQPWVEFAEPEFHGKRVVVERDARGIPARRTVNPPNTDGLPVVKIFAFGGSTTFGYHVSDEHTWPSYLSQVLNDRVREKSMGFQIEVTNYGRAYYYPSQETALLLDLLRSGHRPQAVIFLDGINSGQDDDTPEFYQQLKSQFHNVQFAQPASDGPSLSESLRWVPLVRLAASVNARLGEKRRATVAQREAAKDESKIANVVNVFRRNREIAAAICQLYSITPLFVIQPNPVYNYPVSLYRRPLPDEFYRWRVIATEIYERLRAEPGFVYFGDLFTLYGRERKAVIDELHYGPPFHLFLAEHIAAKIDLTTFDPRRPSMDLSAATGRPRI